jgi:ribosomal-protein-alanine N-acetyltransferase
MIICRELKLGEEARASEIEHECLSTAWSEEQIKNLPEYAVYLGAFEDEKMCGIGSMYVLFDEAQILNVAVSEKFRKRGIGKKILDVLLKTAEEKGAKTITLEVAQDNLNAISLYEKCGFSAVGVRKGFYAGKDAIAMLKEVF